MTLFFALISGFFCQIFGYSKKLYGGANSKLAHFVRQKTFAKVKELYCERMSHRSVVGHNKNLNDFGDNRFRQHNLIVSGLANVAYRHSDSCENLEYQICLCSQLCVHVWLPQLLLFDCNCDCEKKIC
jgi:hypothetical protein